MSSKLEKCPFCGNDEFYRKGWLSGPVEYFYKFDGSPGDNTNMHDQLAYREFKTCYCSKCEKKLPKVKD